MSVIEDLPVFCAESVREMSQLMIHWRTRTYRQDQNLHQAVSSSKEVWPDGPGVSPEAFFSRPGDDLRTG